MKRNVGLKTKHGPSKIMSGLESVCFAGKLRTSANNNVNYIQNNIIMHYM